MAGEGAVKNMKRKVNSGEAVKRQTNDLDKKIKSGKSPLFLCFSFGPFGCPAFLPHLQEIPSKPVGNYKEYQKHHQPEPNGKDGQEGQKTEVLIKFKHGNALWMTKIEGIQ